MPSLMTGTPVDDIRSSPDGHLILHDSDESRWRGFDQHDTVFQDALSTGHQTAVAGWFNPYCRILPDVLDHCFWQFGQVLQNGVTSNGTMRSNAERAAYSLIRDGEVADLLWRMEPSAAPSKDIVAKLHLADYRDITTASDKLLVDPSVTFMLLHLPVPHPTGIFNRRTGMLSTTGTYVDNLALADQVLGHIRKLLEQDGEWDSSTVIVMGDHGWRTELIWSKSPEWTPEEQRASMGGKFDDRPAYVVKLAGQTSGTRIDEPFDAVRTRALMDAVMAGKIQSPEDLKIWVGHQATHSAPLPPADERKPATGNAD
jgi:hypothetical protein